MGKMKQKYPSMTFVHVCKEMPESMRHFDCDFNGIVDRTYSQAYGGQDIDSYSIYKIRNGKVVDRISWYKENQLTPLEKQDRALAEKMVEDYNFELDGEEEE